MVAVRDIGTGNFINKQFRFYSYAALFTSLMFLLTYHDLITVWTGAGHYAGNTILYLLIANFFFSLIGFFMSNMGYALGDIKRNMGIRRCHLRGLEKVKTDFSLIAMAHNLRKIHIIKQKKAA